MLYRRDRETKGTERKRRKKITDPVELKVPADLLLCDGVMAGSASIWRAGDSVHLTTEADPEPAPAAAILAQAGL